MGKHIRGGDGPGRRKDGPGGPQVSKVPMSPDPSSLSEVVSGVISLAHLPDPPKCSVR